MLRLYLMIGGAVAILGLAGGGYAYVRHLQATVAQRTLERDAATAQAGLATETGKIVERTFTKETVVHDQAAAVVQTIQAAPGASDAVPPDVLNGWRSGIAGLRGVVTAAADNSGSANSGRTVPTP